MATENSVELSQTPTRIEDGFGLRCTAIVKHYPGIVALDSLDFFGRMGDVHAILGENAAGKSTFIKILGGSVRPDAGTIDLLGKTLTVQSPRTAREQGISVAYQELSLVSDLTVAQNIWLHLAQPNRIGVLSNRDLRAHTLDLYARLDAPFIDPDARVRSLPYAERQIIEIVKSLAKEPRILVLDEATSTLPATEARWALDLARKLARQGQGALVLFISHRLNEAREVADQVTVFRRGKSVLTGELKSFSDDQVIEAMLGRKPQFLYPPAKSNPRADVVLSVQGLSAGRFLHQVSFDLREGEILGVGGLQGQGQSSLLLALFGMLPARGEIRVQDRPVRIRSPRDAFRAGIGLVLVPEDRRTQGLLLTKSIRENISLSVLNKLTRFGLLSVTSERELVARAIQQLNIKAVNSEQVVTTLSGGNQQKIVVAKLLAVGAKILLFYDLTRGIDVGTKAEIFQLARDLTATGHSIIMYSSENLELTQMCDRILVMREGKIAAALEGNRRTEEAIMQAAFDMTPEVTP